MVYSSGYNSCVCIIEALCVCEHCFVLYLLDSHCSGEMPESGFTTKACEDVFGMLHLWVTQCLVYSKQHASGEASVVDREGKRLHGLR